MYDVNLVFGQIKLQVLLQCNSAEICVNFSNFILISNFLIVVTLNNKILYWIELKTYKVY